MSIILDGSNLTTTGVINSATAQNSTSGTSIDFTGIPAGTKRVTCIFNGVSTNGASGPMIQLGTSGGVVTTGYTNTVGLITTTANTTRGTAITNGIAATWSSGSASYVYSGAIVFVTTGSNSWVATGVLNNTGNPDVTMTAGQITLSGVLDRVRFTMVNGTDTFDAGTVNILYE